MLSLLGALDIHGPYKASLNIIGPFACEGPLAGSVEKMHAAPSSPSAKA